MTTAMPVTLDPRLLVLHEETEAQRLDALVGQVRRSGITTPVAVTPVDDGWFVLDGAHRTTAALMLGLAQVPVRVLPPPASGPVPGWVHLLRSPLAEAALTRLLREHDGSGPVVASVVTGGRETPVRAASDDSLDWVRACRALAHCYSWSSYERLATLDPSDEGVRIAWVMPEFPRLVAVVREHGRLPAGVTRFDLTTTLDGHVGRPPANVDRVTA
ncbi:ParB N-terminal domain-containing protein [Luteipulveratus sp. YIM 133132]|uniref:ParB N-terminal domain-containing protein n=1 Tax=Luteipulveratus flavus TaxID=3031728 RepID=UPI0023AF335E|nr:ParB N-terminal domain-containing protein [Luteipulveratus sp. YIM 133132]MDE9365074.1 ParB N-terminal domain-containing protein [Luteipulveratus sp. YIM 133132]